MSKKQHLLQKAIKIAVDAHTGQFRFNGEPFILHPIRVMQAMDTVEEKVIAVLHDVVEDSNLTIDNLNAMLSIPRDHEILKSLKMLTHEKDVLYAAYIENIATFSLTRKIKIADLKDNLYLGELPDFDMKDMVRARKHFTAYKFLTGK